MTEWTLTFTSSLSSPKLINTSGCSITLTHDYKAKSLCWRNQKVHREVTGNEVLVELGVPDAAIRAEVLPVALQVVG